MNDLQLYGAVYLIIGAIVSLAAAVIGWEMFKDGEDVDLHGVELFSLNIVTLILIGVFWPVAIFAQVKWLLKHFSAEK